MEVIVRLAAVRPETDVANREKAVRHERDEIGAGVGCGRATGQPRQRVGHRGLPATVRRTAARILAESSPMLKGLAT